MRRGSCLAVDRPDKVKDILLIATYWVLMVSYVLLVVRKGSLIKVELVKYLFEKETAHKIVFLLVPYQSLSSELVSVECYLSSLCDVDHSNCQSLFHFYINSFISGCCDDL